MSGARELEFTVMHLCAGVGFGALGFARGHARVGRVQARFRTLGGVDVDSVACADFERIVGAPCARLDLFSAEQYAAFHGVAPPDGWREAIADDLRVAAGGERPDVVFWSPPCKGLSSLQTARRAASDRYQALNELVVRTLDLALDAWGDDPPAMFLLENVPRIATRGRELLERVKLRLDLAGYACAETVHDCGELGGLAQHRRRFLLVARHRAKLRPFLYEPDRRPVRGVGEVVGRLPMPDDPRGGPMHRLPRLQWRTWVRLALIEAGSDWRSLNRLEVVDGVVRGLRLVVDGAGWHAGVLGVRPWAEPSGTVTGESLPFNGEFAVADPRAPRPIGRYEPYGVVAWSEVGRTVTGEAAPGAGPYSVADPRLNCPADGPHRRFNNTYRVVRWDAAAAAVTSGMQSIADPRVGSKSEHGEFSSARHYGVVRWGDPSPAVTGHASHDNGAHSVADPRCPTDRCCPWIWSLDGTRHRPFTTLELAALQGFPLDGILDFELGGTDSLRREHIGNAVPVATAEAIASTMLHTLLLAAAGQSFSLSAAPIWVDRATALALAMPYQETA